MILTEIVLFISAHLMSAAAAAAVCSAAIKENYIIYPKDIKPPQLSTSSSNLTCCLTFPPPAVTVITAFILPTQLNSCFRSPAVINHQQARHCTTSAASYYKSYFDKSSTCNKFRVTLGNSCQILSLTKIDCIKYLSLQFTTMTCHFIVFILGLTSCLQCRQLAWDHSLTAAICQILRAFAVWCGWHR